MIPLGIMGGTWGSEAISVTPDGSIVVGSGSTATGFAAFIWTAADGMQNLQTVLTIDYGMDLGGFEVDYASQITSDGNILIGSGTNAAGYYVGWIATLVQNEPPTAVAGEDQSIRAGDLVALDGTASFDDNTSSELLIYQWSFDSVPAGSSAALDDANSATPTFIADLAGTYTLQLVVTDESGAPSDPDTVVISSDNLAPTAVATSEFTLAIVGQPFLLDGTGSSDPEGDPISFQWSLVAPLGSIATLDDPSSATPSFTPDVEGTYVVALEVSDLIGPGDPAFLEIIGSSPEEFAEEVIVNTADVVDQLEPAQITTEGNAQAFNNFLASAIDSCQKGNEAQAIATLERAIERVDGCALRGAPDGNGKGMDWVTDCDEQLAIYASLIAALDALNQ